MIKSLKIAFISLSSRPKETSIITLLLLIAAIMEMVSMMFVLPIFSIIFQSGQDQSGFIYKQISFLGIQNNLTYLLAALITIISLKSMITLTAKWLVGAAIANLGHTIRSIAVNSICKAEWNYFVVKSVGELANIITVQVDQASNSYLHAARFSSDALVVLFYLIAATLMSPTLALLAFLLTPILMVSLQSFLRMAGQAGELQTKLLRKLSNLFVDRLSGIKQLKSTSEEAVLVEVLNKTSKQFARAVKIDVISKEAATAIFEPLIVICLAIGIYLFVGASNENNSELFLMALLFQRTMSKVGNMQSSLQGVLRSHGFYKTVMDTIQEAKEREEIWVGTNIPTFNKEIKFNNVCFDHINKAVLNKLSFKMTKGSFTAIVGPSGSGKTTVVDLITGLQKASSGQILIDEKIIEDIDMAAWRKKIAYVPQEPIIFNDTVKNNLTLYEDAIDDKSIWEVLRQVQLESHIQSLPNSLNSVAGERGLVFSGGQRQRLMIARALLRKPELIIFDEATSGLDKKTEKQILVLINSIKVTKVVISHQGASRSYADQVLELSPMSNNTAAEQSSKSYE